MAAEGPVLVTGGASGLGAAVVAELTTEKIDVVVLDCQPPEDGIAWIAVDLADPWAADKAVRDAVAVHGDLSAVVTAAGTDSCGPLDGVELTDWVRVIQVNLVGTAAVVRAALPSLRRREGRVVTVASTLGLRALPDATAYCASKFGVVGFTRALATETAGQVGVTLLIPGGMRTAFFDGRSKQYRPGPDADLCDPADVARAVVSALTSPARCQVRELVVTSPGETSWP